MYNPVVKLVELEAHLFDGDEGSERICAFIKKCPLCGGEEHVLQYADRPWPLDTPYTLDDFIWEVAEKGSALLRLRCCNSVVRVNRIRITEGKIIQDRATLMGEVTDDPCLLH